MKVLRGKGIPTEVFLIEDSPGDVRLTSDAFPGANASVQLHVAGDGVEGILTTSVSEADVKSYQPQANCYLSKPVQLDAFDDLVKAIDDFWLTRVRLPQYRLSA